MTPEPTVFVVDDDQAVRRFLCGLIASVDFRVEAYASAICNVTIAIPRALAVFLARAEPVFAGAGRLSLARAGRQPMTPLAR